MFSRCSGVCEVRTMKTCLLQCHAYVSFSIWNIYTSHYFVFLSVDDLVNISLYTTIRFPCTQGGLTFPHVCRICHNCYLSFRYWTFVIWIVFDKVLHFTLYFVTKNCEDSYFFFTSKELWKDMNKKTKICFEEIIILNTAKHWQLDKFYF